jgi:hypothetical protein
MSRLQSPEYPTLIVGDFNFDIRRKSGIDQLWLDHLLSSYDNCFSTQQLPTFFHNNGNSSLIDYVFCSSTHSNNVKSATHSYVNYDWTDHALLSITYQLQPSLIGHGAWKANPFLGKLSAFVKDLLLISNNSLTQISTSILSTRFHHRYVGTN